MKWGGILTKKVEYSVELSIRELEGKALKYGVIKTPLTEEDQTKLRSKIEDVELFCRTSETTDGLTILLAPGKLDEKLLKGAHERIIKNFMDVVILAELKTRSLSGYDVISFIHNKFHLLVSSGTVYSLLYSLERNGLIEGTWNERKRVYKLTEKGERTIETILGANDKIKNLIASLLRVQSISQNPIPKRHNQSHSSKRV